MTISIELKHELTHLINEINELGFYAFLCFEKDKISSFVINNHETLAKITFIESTNINNVYNYINQLKYVISAFNLAFFTDNQ